MRDLFKKFNIIPNDEKLYDVAFMHGSYGIKHGIDYNYERLEFLGDSVLNMIVSEYLYKKYPDYEEGKLTKIRANYVCRKALIFYSHELGLDKYLKISVEENNMSQNEVLSITADIFESFLGAIFLDQGMEVAKKHVSSVIFKHIDNSEVFFHDYKSTMKEYGDAEEVDVEYNILEEYGVPHDKTFIMEILIDGKQFGVGKGKNKKEATQNAAREAMKRLKIDEF